MLGLIDGRRIEVVASSGMLCVTLRPKPHWLAGVMASGSDVIFAALLYHYWSLVPSFMRVLCVFFLVTAPFSLMYQFLGEEIVEIDSHRLTIRKGIHGWERKREYQVNECSDLEWVAGHEGGSYLTCKAGRWPIKFGIGLPERDANEIFSALQQALPDVAQKIFTCQAGKEHFITLGLNKQ